LKVNICVIGMGYVGLTTASCFAEIGHKVIGIDNSIERIKELKQGSIPFFEPGLQDLVTQNIQKENLIFSDDIKNGIQNSDIIFVTVGTPISAIGDVDTSQIDSVIKSISKYINSYKIIVTKSTIPIGMNRQIISTIKASMDVPYEFDVVSNPEFLSEGSAVKDMFNMDRVIIGSNSIHAIKVIEQLYKVFDTQFLITDFESSEMIKYASNAFLATKISFINEISILCENIKADVLKVAEGMGMDRRIGNEFLKAGVGYGGSCFHKDINALLKISEKVNVNLEIACTTERVNNKQRKRVVEKVERVLNNELYNKTATILGISFKPNTNDIRCAPSLDIIKMLKEKGMNIKVYDPIVESKQLKEVCDVIYCEDVYDALIDSDVAIVMTEWDEIKEINWEKAKSIMRELVIVDGRNIYEIEKINNLGYVYEGMGRGVTL
jgi:UDPglucose 6-dehydrogenase